jgi:hypothetical protein
LIETRLIYNGNFYWRAGPRLSGVLRVDTGESVVAFDDAQATTTLNKRTTDTRDATIVVEVHPGGICWAASTNRARERPSLTWLNRPRHHTRRSRSQVRDGSQNSVTLTRRSRRVRTSSPRIVNFVALIDTDFTDHETELQATWQLTGKSTLNGRLTWLERKNQHLPQRDFSGTAGELGYVWTPTGKLSFGLSATANILPWTADTQASYRVDDTLALRPTWQVSDKIRLSLNPFLTVSDFRGPVAPLTRPLRHDDLVGVTFAAEWSPYQGVLLVATLQHSQRKSTHPEFEFKDRTAALNASLKF